MKPPVAKPNRRRCTGWWTNVRRTLKVLTRDTEAAFARYQRTDELDLHLVEMNAQVLLPLVEALHTILNAEGFRFRVTCATCQVDAYAPDDVLPIGWAYDVASLDGDNCTFVRCTNCMAKKRAHGFKPRVVREGETG